MKKKKTKKKYKIIIRIINILAAPAGVRYISLQYLYQVIIYFSS